MRRLPIEPGRRVRAWNMRDTRRQSASQRGYSSTWQTYSKQYRRLHPLCVQCLLDDRVKATACVDHIVPKHSCPELFWHAENHASLCQRCHGIKTRKEPQSAWQPRCDRIVVCGVPGTGKTTFAQQTGYPYFDAAELELCTIDSIVAARDEWIARQTGACVVIVESIISASQLAARLHGVARHMTSRIAVD